jgi:hypothetical protein
MLKPGGLEFSEDSPVEESVKRKLESEDRGIAIVGAVTRKRLVTD